MANNPDQKAYEAIHVRNANLAEVVKSHRTIAIVAMSFGFASIALAVALYIFRPVPQNYAITPDGRNIPMTPISEGVLSTVGLGNFVSNAIASSFNFDFRNYASQLGSVRTMYTEAGYNSFSQAIASRVQEAKEKMCVSSATIASVPVLVKSGVHMGVMKYKFQTIVLLEMLGNKECGATSRLMVETVVERVPQHQYPLGIAISRLNAMPAPANN